MRTDDFLEVMHELVAFVRVAEVGSFSGAALQLGVTPSAISRQVSRLEKAMGVTLLRRTTRQLRLHRQASRWLRVISVRPKAWCE